MKRTARRPHHGIEDIMTIDEIRCEMEYGRLVSRLRTGWPPALWTRWLRAWLMVALCLVAGSASAQEYRAGFDSTSKLYIAAAAADWTSTVYAFSRSPYVREANPLYSWTMPSIEDVAGGRPASAGQIAATVALSAGFDIASTWLVDRYVTPRHPKVAKVLKVVGIAVRSGQAARNVMRVQSLPEHMRR